MTRLRRFRAAALAAAPLLLAIPAAAQDFERVAPRVPEAPPPATELPAPPLPPGPVQDGGTRVLDELRGLVFVGSAEAVRAGGVDADGVVVEGLPLLERPGFREAVAPFLGRPVTLDDLNEIARRTVLFYRDQDRPLVDVLVPEQDVPAGAVQILVLEFRAGEVRAEGNRWFSDERLVGQVRTRPGEEVSARGLLEDVNWLNRNPFRSVDVVYQRGQRVGETDVVLRTADRFPLRVYAGGDNAGQPDTGRARLFAGFNWGDAFGADQLLSYQLIGSPDFWRERSVEGVQSWAQSASWTVPLPWRHVLSVFGSYGESEPRLPAPFAQQATSWQVSARYAVPLGGPGAVTTEAQAGFDVKRSDSRLTFGGLEALSGTSDVVQAVLGYSVAARDGSGTTQVAAQGFLSPGGLTARNDDDAFRPGQGRSGRVGADARYAYGRLSVERLQELPSGFSLSARALGQLSTTNLLSSEQLGLGGADYVRGFEEREVNADEGVFVSLELRTPEIPAAELLAGADVRDRLSFLAFLDVGYAALERPAAGEQPLYRIASAGAGVRYALGTSLTLRADYGRRISEMGIATRAEDRVHIGFTVAY